MDVLTQSKSDRTKTFILQKVAPVFNRNGYAATTMAMITKATGLTKGAIYGNFGNKEDLSIKAFQHNVKMVIAPLAHKMQSYNTVKDKLLGIVDFYKGYYAHMEQSGGCPILNVGIDSNHSQSKLLAEVKRIIKKLQLQIAEIIAEGQQDGSIHKTIDPLASARELFSQIEGGIYMASIMKDEIYMTEMISRTKKMIHNELLK